MLLQPESVTMSESCPRTIEVSAYLDDELSVAERAQLQAHLASCERCSAMLMKLGALRDELRRLPDEGRADSRSTRWT